MRVLITGRRSTRRGRRRLAHAGQRRHKYREAPDSSLGAAGLLCNGRVFGHVREPYRSPKQPLRVTDAPHPVTTMAKRIRVIRGYSPSPGRSDETSTYCWGGACGRRIRRCGPSACEARCGGSVDGLEGNGPRVYAAGRRERGRHAGEVLEYEPRNLQRRRVPAAE